MIINFIYNSLKNKNIDVDKIFNNISDEDIIINIFDTSYTKEAKKGRVILNKYAAKVLPFFEITDDENRLIYVSYGEVNNPSNEEINKIIKSYIK